MSKKKDSEKKITGAWAFLNNPVPIPPEAADDTDEAAPSSKKPRGNDIDWKKVSAWIKKRRWAVLGGAGGLLLLLVGIWFAFIREGGPRADHVAIQGEWRITREGSTPGQDDGQMTIRIKGDRWTYVVNGRDVTTWQVELKPDGDPREIDLTLLERDGQPIKVAGTIPKQVGVYFVDRKTFQVALAPEHSGRPKSLDDPDAPALMLIKVR